MATKEQTNQDKKKFAKYQAEFFREYLTELILEAEKEGNLNEIKEDIIADFSKEALDEHYKGKNDYLLEELQTFRREFLVKHIAELHHFSDLMIPP